MPQNSSRLQTECGDCPIRHRAVCSRCEPDELSFLESIKSYKTFAAGEAITWAGEELRFVGSVVSGVASVSHTMEDGRRQMVGLLLPSDFVGRPGRRTTPYDVVAATEVLLCRFDRTAFENLLTKSPALSNRLLEMMLDELDAAREWMLLLGRKTAREKISSLLAIFARRDANLRKSRATGKLLFDLPLTREEMADYLGLTLETVSRQISALKRDGVIVLDGKRSVTVPDFARLLDETGDDTDGGIVA
ncbi:MAG: Crp/Fnr family transcriptional regulator [Rhodobacteraceae bacterium]|nr:Crp/Fnr family transcriptional regulator [Paracoccaceae bacterium]